MKTKWFSASFVTETVWPSTRTAETSWKRPFSRSVEPPAAGTCGLVMLASPFGSVTPLNRRGHAVLVPGTVLTAVFGLEAWYLSRLARTR